MTAGDVSDSTLWAVIDPPLQWIILNSTRSGDLKLPETLVSGAIGLDSPLDAMVLQMLRRFTGT
jgi:hypothetical protein